MLEYIKIIYIINRTITVYYYIYDNNSLLMLNRGNKTILEKILETLI